MVHDKYCLKTYQSLFPPSMKLNFDLSVVSHLPPT
jgi:hypothetical protein